MNNTHLNKNIKIAIVLILFFNINTYFWVSEMLHNFGIPYLRYQKLWFFILPGLYILYNSLINNRFVFRNGLIFIVFYILHYSFENYAYGSSYIPDSPIDLLNRWWYIFIAYLFFINAGHKYLIFILKTSISLLLINLTLIYFDFFGIINVSEITLGSDEMENRLSSTQNLNLVNDMGVFSIFIFYWLKLLGSPFRIYKKVIPSYVIIMYIIPLVLLQASRGSFLLLILGITLFLYFKWGQLQLKIKIFLFFIIPIGVYLQDGFVEFLNTNVTVVNRIIDTPLSIDDSEVGRIYQIEASWQNFKTSPVIGLGYLKASRNVFHGIVRSNFQYTQILASGGIILFGVYFLMVFKFFGYSIKLIKKNIIVLSILTFVLLEFIFRRPEPYFAVMAYVVYVLSRENKMSIFQNKRQRYKNI